MQEIEEIKKEISKGKECSSKFREKIKEVPVLTNVTIGLFVCRLSNLYFIDEALNLRKCLFHRKFRLLNIEKS